MPRPIRIEYAGAAYHVMARGNQGHRLYADDGDRKLWLATLAEACLRTGWRVHAWVLMGNHYHLLLETPEPNLVAGMKWLQGTYTQRFNARHRLRGHLFQGRYRAIPVAADTPDYFRVVSTYIHLNPARSKLIRLGEQPLTAYRWSSYRAYVRPTASPPEWLVTERVLGSVGLGPAEHRRYEQYMETRALECGRKELRKQWEHQWRELRRGWYVGPAEFRLDLLARIKNVLRGHRRESYSGRAVSEHGEAAATQLLAKGLRALRLAGTALAAQPKGQLEKQVLAWWVSEQTTVPRRWLSERLGMGHASRVTHALRTVRTSQAPRVVALKQKLNRIAV